MFSPWRASPSLRRPPWRLIRVVILTFAIVLAHAVANRVASSFVSGLNKRGRLRQGDVPVRASEQGDAKTVDATRDKDPGDFLGTWWNETVEFWEATEVFNPIPLKNDTADEAIALQTQLDLVNDTIQRIQTERAAEADIRSRSNLGSGRSSRDKNDLSTLLGPVGGLMAAYYRMRLTRTFSKRPVKRGIASALLYLQVLIFGIFLRVLAPRLLAADNIDEIFGAASALGIPDRATLVAGLDYIRDYDPVVKIGLYTAAFVVEKALMVSEIIPFQIALKTIAPVLFGGLLPGAIASATCETLGASFNHFIGKTFLPDKLRSISVFGSPPIGEADWFGKIEKASKKDGFQVTLLLRLAPIIPLPFDSYWYLLGALGVPWLQFAPAHFLGCLKTAFLDASFGQLLLESVTVTDAAVKSQAQQVLLTETLAFALVAALVSSVATKLVNDLLEVYEDEEELDERASVATAALETGVGSSSSDAQLKVKIANRVD